MAVNLSEINIDLVFQQLQDKYRDGFSDYPLSDHFCVEIDGECYYDTPLFKHALDGIVDETNSLLIFQFMVEVGMINIRKHHGDNLYACL